MKILGLLKNQLTHVKSLPSPTQSGYCLDKYPSDKAGIQNHNLQVIRQEFKIAISYSNP